MLHYHLAKALLTYDKIQNYKKLRKIDDHIASMLNPKDILSSLIEYAYKTNPDIIGCRLDLCEDNILKKVHGKGIWETIDNERPAIDCKIFNLPKDVLRHECVSFALEDEPCGIKLKEAGIDTSDIQKIVCYRLQIADELTNQKQGVLSVQLIKNAEYTSDELDDRLKSIISKTQIALKTANLYEAIAKDYHQVSLKDAYKVKSLEMLQKMEAFFKNSSYRPEKIKVLSLTGLTINGGMAFTRAIIFHKEERSNKWRFEMGVGPLTKDEADTLWVQLRGGLSFDDIAKKDCDKDTPLHKRLREIEFNNSSYFYLRQVTDIDHQHVDPEFLSLLAILNSHGFHVIVPFQLLETKGFVYIDNAFKANTNFLFDKDIIDIATLYVDTMVRWIEQKSYEDKIRELKENEIKAKENAIWEEVAILVPHKMSTHCSGIVGNLKNLIKMLAANTSSTEDINKTINNILSSSQTLNSFLEEFMKYSKMDELIFEKVNLKEFIEDCLRTCGLRAKSIDISCIVDKLIEVDLDKMKIGASLVEILSNAADFVPKEGGQIKIEASIPEAQEISFLGNLNSERKYIRINIINNGKGVPKEYREKIFEPLFSGRPKQAYFDKIHSGLGLAIAKKYINKHGGHIYVKDKEENGEEANFELLLPFHINEKREEV